MKTKGILAGSAALIVAISAALISLSNRQDAHRLPTGEAGEPPQEEFECVNRSDDSALSAEAIDLVKSQTIGKFWPKLSGAQIRITTTLKKPDYFLDTRFSVGAVFQDHLHRDYRIRVNPILLQAPPRPDGLEAILAHELKHIVDYSERSGAGLLLLVSGYGLSDPASSERQTDLAVLKLGLGEGLIEYRCWQWRRLTPAQWRKKTRIYYSPNEIRAWINEHP